ncbi:MAG: DUF5060 domain-containing protein [Candidatus Brocadiia bacterium]
MCPNTVRHCWETVEITLKATHAYANPYTDVTVWVDLEGPGFSERCYGFWDGGATFRVRVTATAPGEWCWTSGCRPADPGLRGKTGVFTAVEWTEEEKQENPCRRGFIRPTDNGHAFQYADGTPFFLLGDTWWPAGTFRYPLADRDVEHPPGPGMTLQDALRYRAGQGYNSVAMIAAFPAWANDGRPAKLVADDGTCIRQAWEQAGTGSAKDMHDETGNRPFRFPGRVPGYEDVFPDIERPNPAYWRSFDATVRYMNSVGFIPFIEVARRDVGQAWRKYYDWPESYVRYVQYVWSRLQANNCLLSPIHYDWRECTIRTDEWNAAANLVVERYGPPPFGQPVGCNPDGSSLHNFGHVDRARWLSFHQIGNRRTHESHEMLPEQFHQKPPVPSINGEPYYEGWHQGPQAPVGSAEAARNCRGALWGSVLSGALGGHVYGAEGLWAGDVEPEAEHRWWESLTWPSGAQMQHCRSFLLSQGTRYRDLVPQADLVQPSRAGAPDTYRGWAYCARTEEWGLLMLYFEKDCPRATIEGLPPGREYEARWFDPREGEWLEEPGRLAADQQGELPLPPFPGEAETSQTDWALKLTAVG